MQTHCIASSFTGRGGRSEFYPDDGIYRYDCLLWMGGGEHDVERGSPFGEDIYAYHRSGQEHVQWTYQQTIFRDAGTSGDWSRPSGGYDLRATPQSCPECGTESQMTNAETRNPNQ